MDRARGCAWHHPLTCLGAALQGYASQTGYQQPAAGPQYSQQGGQATGALHSSNRIMFGVPAHRLSCDCMFVPCFEGNALTLVFCIQDTVVIAAPITWARSAWLNSRGRCAPPALMRNVIDEAGGMTCTQSPLRTGLLRGAVTHALRWAAPQWRGAVQGAGAGGGGQPAAYGGGYGGDAGEARSLGAGRMPARVAPPPLR